MFGNLFEEEEDDRFNSTSSGVRVTKGVDEPPPLRGRTNLCGIKNQGGTCYLNSLLQTLLFTPEFRGKACCHWDISEQMITSIFSRLTMLCCLVEELFSLGPQELGCLEDKGKPGAKVSSCTESCCINCENQCLSIKVKYKNTGIHFPFISVGQSHPAGAAEIVCFLATGGPTECLHHWSHWQFWLEQQWGLSLLLALKRTVLSPSPSVKFSFACYMIMWTGENAVIGSDIVCFNR